MELTDVFGLNVKAMFLEWFHGDFATEFAQRFPGKGMTFVLLDPDDTLAAVISWRRPLEYAMIASHLGDAAVARAPDGTLENVGGKLRFCLRNMEDSVVAETNPRLVRAGDFPWEGAGNHRDLWWGGVSGLLKKEDWELFCQCVDWIDDLVTRITKKAIQKADALRKQEGCPVGTKYLKGITITLDELNAEANDAEATPAT